MSKEIVITSPGKAKERLGATGTSMVAGYLSEEHIADLQGNRWAKIVDEMRRSDEVIGGIYTAIRTAIQGGTYKFIPDNAADKESVEMTKELEWAFLKAPWKKWSEVIDEYLTIILNGFYLGCPVTGVAEYNGKKKWIFENIAWFSPKTIEKWECDDNDRLTRVYQMTTNSDKIVNKWIDASRLIHIAIEKEGNNFEGISPFRRAYGNYYRKKLMQKIKLVGIERAALGFPDIVYPPEWKEGSAEFDALIDWAKSATSANASYIMRPDGTKVNMLQIPFDAEKLQSVIQSENTDMSYVVLADFLMLGRDGGGNRMLGDSKRKNFLQSMSYLIWQLIDVINNRLVPMYMTWNYGRYEDGKAGKLSVMGVEQKGFEEWTRGLANLANAKLINPDLTLEKQLRDLGDMPPPEEINTEDAPPAPIPPKDTPAPVEDEGVDDVSRMADMPVFENRTKTAYENKCDFAEIGKALKYGVEDFNYEQKKLLQKVIEDYIYELKKRTVKDGGNIYNVVNDLEALGRVAFEKGMIDLIKQHVIAGQKQIDFELSAKAAFADTDKLPAGVYAWVKAQAKKITDDKIGDIEKRIGGAALNQASFYPVNKKLSAAALDEVLKSAREAGDEWVGSASNLSGASAVPFAVNVGRRQAAEANNEVIGFQYSAILDDVTTPTCRQLDGQTRAVDDYESAKFDPPNHFNCRSILVPITALEGEPQGGFTGFKISGDGARQSQTFKEATK